MWNDLSKPWQACLQEAWKAYCAGSLPIGAVVVDDNQQVIASGRNRIYSEGSLPDGIHNEEMMHAELQALLAIPVDKWSRNSTTLYTTMEPCPLCMGAFYMSGSRTLQYTARDPYAGSTNLLGTTWYLSRKEMTVVGPVDDLEDMIVGITIADRLEREHEKHQKNIEMRREITPRGVTLGERLHEEGEMSRMRDEGWEIDRVVNQIAGILNKLS